MTASYKSVAVSHDLRQHRHFAAAEAVRIATAIEPFVVMTNDLPDQPQRSQLAAQAGRR